MNKKKAWLILSIGGLLVSVASLFLPVILYEKGSNHFSYNIVDLLFDDQFAKEILNDYYPDFYENFKSTILFRLDIAPQLTIAAVVIGVLAIVVAFVGIISMSKQYESAWPFRLALIGLIGTAIPAVAMLIVYLASNRYFYGTMSLGAYVYVTPLAMIVACITVTNRHRLSKSEQQAVDEARLYIHPAGNLPKTR